MGFEADLGLTAALALPEVEHKLDKFAAEVCEYAKRIAPVFDPGRDRRSTPGIGDPGDYRESIRVVDVKAGHRRLQTDDPKMYWVEMGSEHMPEFAVFTRTAEHFGSTTGPIMDAGVLQAHHHLRRELDRLADMRAAGAGKRMLDAQRARVTEQRMKRSAAFRAARKARRSR